MGRGRALTQWTRTGAARPSRRRAAARGHVHAPARGARERAAAPALGTRGPARASSTHAVPFGSAWRRGPREGARASSRVPWAGTRGPRAACPLAARTLAAVPARGCAGWGPCARISLYCSDDGMNLYGFQEPQERPLHGAWARTDVPVKLGGSPANVMGVRSCTRRWSCTAAARVPQAM